MDIAFIINPQFEGKDDIIFYNNFIMKNKKIRYENV